MKSVNKVFFSLSVAVASTSGASAAPHRSDMAQTIKDIENTRSYVKDHIAAAHKSVRTVTKDTGKAVIRGTKFVSNAMVRSVKAVGHGIHSLPGKAHYLAKTTQENITDLWSNSSQTEKFLAASAGVAIVATSYFGIKYLLKKREEKRCPYCHCVE